LDLHAKPGAVAHESADGRGEQHHPGKREARNKDGEPKQEP
jgi:hypothetical protein